MNVLRFSSHYLLSFFPNKKKERIKHHREWIFCSLRQLRNAFEWSSFYKGKATFFIVFVFFLFVWWRWANIINFSLYCQILMKTKKRKKRKNKRIRDRVLSAYHLLFDDRVNITRNMRSVRYIINPQLGFNPFSVPGRL